MLNPGYNDITKYENLIIKGILEKNSILIEEGYKNKKLTINFLGENASILIGKNANIQGVITVSNNSTVTIGDNFASTGGVTILCRDDCSVNIGNECMFATSIIIRTSDEHTIFDIQSGSILNFNDDVKIGHHVWICDNVLILKGVEVGDGSVVGARSVVTGLIPSHALCAGTPARVLREGVSWGKSRPPKK